MTNEWLGRNEGARCGNCAHLDKKQLSWFDNKRYHFCQHSAHRCWCDPKSLACCEAHYQPTLLRSLMIRASREPSPPPEQRPNTCASCEFFKWSRSKEFTTDGVCTSPAPPWYVDPKTKRAMSGWARCDMTVSEVWRTPLTKKAPEQEPVRKIRIRRKT